MNIAFDDKEVNKKLDKIISKLLPDAIRQGLEEACLIVESGAKKNCNVDDGVLRSSITHEVENNEGIIGTNVEYAPYYHEGTGIYAIEGNGRQTPWTYCDAKGEFHTTKGQKPKQFLKKAVDENKNRIINCFENKLEEV